MAHAQKPDSVFQRNGRVHLYRRGCQFSRVLDFLECGSGENDCSNTGWTVPSQTEDCLTTHSIRLFPLHFSSRASPCATRFLFHSTKVTNVSVVIFSTMCTKVTYQRSSVVMDTRVLQECICIRIFSHLVGLQTYKKPTSHPSNYFHTIRINIIFK